VAVLACANRVSVVGWRGIASAGAGLGIAGS
jgi:hypothetical protein